MADGTIIEDPKTSDPPKSDPPPVDPPKAADPPKDIPWPEDWRARMANGDEKELKRLERFAAPADVFKSYRAIEQRISSGELKANKPFPDKGSDQEKSEWRKEHGIPEAPEKYDLDLGNGVVVGEDDKAVVDSFLKRAHSSNMSASAVKEAVKWWYDEKAARVKQAEEAFADRTKATEDELRVEWQGDYRRNLSIVNGFLDSRVSEKSEMKGLIQRAVQTNAEFAKFMAGIAMEMNPTATVVPGDGANAASAIEDEIAVLEKKMRDKTSDYWKGSSAEKNQARLRDLYRARDSRKKK